MSGLRPTVLAEIAFLLVPAPLRIPPTVLHLAIDRLQLSETLHHETLPPIYLVAPVSGRLSDDRENETNKLEEVLKASVKRVDLAPSEFSQVQKCPNYPCEVVVEEVVSDDITRTVTFQLRFRVIKSPGDHSPDIPGHQLKSESWRCSVSNLQSQKECEEELAPSRLADRLKEHDQTYHSGLRP